jgi:hypothetical protein
MIWELCVRHQRDPFDLQADGRRAHSASKQPINIAGFATPPVEVGGFRSPLECRTGGTFQ